MKRFAILLVRVSTLEQDYNAQIQDLTTYGKSLGYTDFHIIETTETAFADFTQKVGTNEMFRYIDDHPEYNTVLTTELSRLARRQSILHQIKEHCINRQIQIYVKDLDFKLLDDNGKINQQGEIIFTLFGLFAESEIKQRLDRFTRKRKELKEQGLSIGGKILFGYNRHLLPEINKNTLIINDEQASIVRQIYNWYLNGLETLNNPLIKNPSVKLISLECVKRGFHHYTHSKRNVNKLLKEQAYTGEKITNNKWKNPKFGVVANEPKYLISNAKIKYPPIIDIETFNMVQEKLRSNIINSDKETKHTTLLAKLINCPSCGRKLQGNYRLRNGEYKNSYRCTSRGDTQPCDNKKSISMPLIDSAIWSFIKTDLPTLSKTINEINPDTFLLELENYLANILNRENDIKTEISENVQILETVGKLRSTNVISLIQSTGIKIEKLEKELDKLNNEKARIETDKLLLNEKQNDIESIINDNLVAIENDKELLKRYINYFVDEVRIIENSTFHSFIQIVINESYIRKETMDYFDIGLPVRKVFGYIYLNKRDNNRIKGYYHKNVSASRGNIEYDELTLTMLEYANKEIESNSFYFFKSLNYTKLNVYNQKK